MYDFTSSKETQLTSAATGNAASHVSPEGKTVAFIRDAKGMRVLDLASKAERPLATGYLARLEKITCTPVLESLVTAPTTTSVCQFKRGGCAELHTHA